MFYINCCCPRIPSLLQKPLAVPAYRQHDTASKTTHAPDDGIFLYKPYARLGAPFPYIATQIASVGFALQFITSSHPKNCLSIVKPARTAQKCRRLGSETETPVSTDYSLLCELKK